MGKAHALLAAGACVLAGMLVAPPRADVAAVDVPDRIGFATRPADPQRTVWPDERVEDRSPAGDPWWLQFFG